MGHLINSEFIETFGEFIANDWIKIAKSLKLRNADIKEIQEQRVDNRLAAIAMLQRWEKKETRGEEYKLFSLRQAVMQVNRHDILNYLQAYEIQVLSLT